MSFASSPSRDVTELFSRRRVTNIPSDQKNLLEQPDSWAVNLKNQPHGLAHIPGHVLETVKAAYVARQSSRQKLTPQSKKRSASSVASPSSKRMRNGTTSTPNPDFEKPPASSPERPISSWSSSPNRDQPEQSATVEVAAESTTQSSIIHETPKTGSVRPPPRQRYIPPPEHSSSPDEAEDDLETRIPDAQPHSESVNRPAVRLNPTVPSPFSTNRTMATPPCAQPSHPTQTVVPNTVVANKETLTENKSPDEGQFRPTRRYKLIDVDAVGRKRKKSYNEKERLPPTITLPPSIESSIPTSSDSIIPNTYKVTTTQESIRESIEENETADHVEEVVPSTNDQKPAVNHSSNRRVESIAQLEHSGTAKDTTDTANQSQQRPATPSQMGPSKVTPISNSRKQLSSQKTARKSIPPTPLRIEPGARSDPYEIFVHHYPAYAGDDCGRKLPGTKENFVNACVYLNYLRKRRGLRDCLYDDFIRAFPCHYKEYVNRFGKSAMVAIDWFNKLKDAPAYDKYVVHRGNLSHILRSYPEEFANATASIHATSNSKKDSDEISIYTSSEEEEGDPEEEDGPSSSPGRTSRQSRRSVESQQPIATIENDMDIDIPEVVSSQLSSTRRRKSSTLPEQPRVRSKPMPPPAPAPLPPSSSSSRSQRVPTQAQSPLSSRAPEFLTQAPPGPSPKIPQTSMLPPSTFGTSVIKPRAPRPSQYFSRISSSGLSSSTPAGRSEKDRARLQEHFMKRKSRNGVNGLKSSSGRSSSGRTE
ncbi:hypothetical protein FSARC_2173 [Fusarium sarcochroum]|uniref:Uncharacterized protein n=1 Tax=Fusarium sarcochroum TaxID=1208366 RepID=A0A8H4U6V7_9HYPO|nr:hypothetical protein FSARC_2173 [Fusarium sarcochroum]